MFDVFQDTQTVEGHQALYRKIEMRSVGYEEFMEDRETICSKNS